MQIKMLVSGALTATLCLVLSGCGTSNSGGYFKNDGPPASGLLGNAFANTPNAVPKYEKPHRGANKPYTVGGKRYTPITGDQPMTQKGLGSWYGKMFHGRKTSTGEIYNMYAMTAAHKTMELPSYAKVTNLENNRSIIVRVNDRGPFIDNRIIDLSYAAASKLDYVKKGTARLKVERIRMADIKAGRIPSTFSRILSDDDQQTKNADALAIAAVIGAAHAIKNTQNVKTTYNDHASTNPAPQPAQQTQLPPAATTASSLSPEAVDLSGAVNLTEAAQGTMVSTEVTLNAPSTTTTSTPAAASSGSWKLQAGAFSTQANAQQYAKTLQTQLSHPVAVHHDGKLYRVLIGNYATREAATLDAEALGTLIGKKPVPFEAVDSIAP